MHDLRQALLPVAVASALACGTPTHVEAQDIAFVVPLDAARSFLPASQVLPRAVFDHFEHPLTVVDEPDALYGALSTVTVRLDACFQEGASPGPCQPQVRLVLQPVFDEAGGPTTRDAAVHVFYSVSEAQVVELARALGKARGQHGLTVTPTVDDAHPGFARAAWVDAVRTLLSPLLTAERIVRVTSMSVHASNQAWIFAGNDYAASQPSRINIPTLTAAQDDHVTSTGGSAALEVTIDPGSSAESALMPIIAPNGIASATTAQVSAAAAAVQRLEDPAVHNPGTVDCATCHVAALTQRAFTQRSLGIDAAVAAPEVYGDTRNLRAFGYFFTRPAVSPRVQREIALVRDDFTRRLEP